MEHVGQAEKKSWKHWVSLLCQTPALPPVSLFCSPAFLLPVESGLGASRGPKVALAGQVLLMLICCNYSALMGEAQAVPKYLPCPLGEAMQGRRFCGFVALRLFSTGCSTDWHGPGATRWGRWLVAGSFLGKKEKASWVEQAKTFPGRGAAGNSCTASGESKESQHLPWEWLCQESWVKGTGSPETSILPVDRKGASAPMSGLGADLGFRQVGMVKQQVFPNLSNGASNLTVGKRVGNIPASSYGQH